MPLAGCDPVYTAQEQAAYDQAATGRSVAAVNDFLRKYPDSPLVRQLLTGLPPATLKRLSKSAVQGLSPDVVRSLPPDILALLGLTRPKAPPPIRTQSSGYDG